MPWILAQLGSRLFGLNCSVVQEMVIMPEVCEVPGAHRHIRGVINLRGSVIPLVDLRLRLGMSSSKQETESLCSLLEQRAQDHREWVDELESSVREKRAFTLARDPAQCAFGQWYGNFKTDNVLVAGFLKRFDAPHRRIHSLAAEVEQLAALEGVARAQEMLQHARAGVLSSMLRLFAEFQRVVRESRREIAIVLKGRAGAFAVSADSVASVERLAVSDTESLAGKGLDLHEDLVTSVAKRARGRELVLILASDAILDAATCAMLAQG